MTGARPRPLDMDPRAPISGASPGTPDPDGGTRRFRRVVAVGVLGTCVVALAPASVAGVVYLLLGTGMLVTAAIRLRGLDPPIRRAATWMVLAGSCSLGGALVRGVEAALTGATYPFPSIADGLSIVSYPMFVVAMALVVRGRIGRPDADLSIDALVGAIAVAVLQWQVVLLPSLGVGPTAGVGAALNIAYAGLSILLVAAAIGISLAGGHRSTSNRLLAASLTGVVLLDLTATLVTTGRLAAEIRLVPAAAVFVLGAAGLVHPSVTGLMARPSSRSHLRRLTYVRIGVLGLALVIPPALVAVALRVGDTSSLWLPVAASIVLAPLVVLRLGRLVQRNTIVADIESAVRVVSEDLVGAASVEEIAAITECGVAAVTGAPDSRPEFVLLDATDAGAAGGSGARSHPATAPLVRAAVTARQQAGASPASGELVELGVPGWVAAVVVVDGRVRGAALLEPANLSVEQVQAVQTVCRDAALALRSVDRTELTVRRRSEERFGSLIDNSSDIVVVLGPDRRPVYVSPVATRLLGYPLDYLGGLEFTDLVHPGDAEVVAGFEASILAGRRQRHEVRLRHVAGTYHWFEIVGTDLSHDPNVRGVVLTAREIGDRKSAEERLVLSESRFKALVQHSSDLVVAVLPDGELRYASPSVGALTGRPVEQPGALRLEELFPNSGLDWSEALRSTGADPAALLTFWFDDVTGRRRHIEATVRDLRAEPALGAFVLNGRDVTERTAMVERLEYQATHDGLTGLPNRALASSSLTTMLGRNPGRSTVAVISVDLDDFKSINDSLGHAVGDRVLTTIAQRVARLAEDDDTAARSSGDEFLLVVERAHGEDRVVELTGTLLDLIGRPVEVDDRTITVTASAGVAVDQDRSHSAEDLLRAADTAMYRSKSEGRGTGRHRITTFEPSMHADSMTRFELRADLAEAIAVDGIEAHYQPVVDLCTQRIVGLEALVRWNHPTRGSLSPGVFVPIAEEHGLVLELGRWMRRRACRDLAHWRRTQPDTAAHLTVAVNVAAAELHDERLVPSVAALLDEFDLPPDCLTLEVTESSLMTETELVRSRMEALRSLGLRLAIDDFGTGYSSLGYIHRFNFDILKIDRSFVSALESATNRQIITSVTDLAAQLRASVVAEGIETVEQESTLGQLGIELGQGFLYSRPVPAEAIGHLLGAQRIDLT